MRKNLMKKILFLLLSVIILCNLAIIVNADEATEDESKLIEQDLVETKFALDKTTTSIYVNQKIYISYSGRPKDSTVTWESSNTNVATVDKTGSITGIAIGKATITAKVNGQESSCEVEVKYRKATISASSQNNNFTLIVGENKELNLSATAKDYHNQEIATIPIQYKSSDPNIAKVDNNGKITGVSAGTTKITAVAGDSSYTANVTVIASDTQNGNVSNNNSDKKNNTNTSNKVGKLPGGLPYTGAKGIAIIAAAVIAIIAIVLIIKTNKYKTDK